MLSRLTNAFWHRLEGAIVSVATDQPLIALTFDDGPHPQYTPRLLALLEQYDARGTFFMVGQNAQRYPEIVRRVASGGHAIGNHSWSHPSFPEISRAERRREIRETARVLAPYGQRLFRPPFGHLDRPAALDLVRLRQRLITWSIVGYDWLDHDASWLSQNLLDRIRPGSIILLHDTLFATLDPRYLDRTPMLDALERVLSTLRESYRFVTIPELLRNGRPQRRLWRRQGEPGFMAQLEPGY